MNMELENILDGSNGIIGRYSVTKVGYNSSSGGLEVGLIFAPYLMAQNIQIIPISSKMMEKENRKQIFRKRSNIIKKLLD
jgi:hypothetical protein